MQSRANRCLPFVTVILLGTVGCIDTDDNFLQDIPSIPVAQEFQSPILTNYFDDSDRGQRLTGYSTRCAEYVATAQYEAGLAYCNRALELYEAHWRGLRNRAVAHLAFGQTALA